jgi:hypothetical protein
MAASSAEPAEADALIVGGGQSGLWRRAGPSPPQRAAPRRVDAA